MKKNLFAVAGLALAGVFTTGNAGDGTNNAPDAPARPGAPGDTSPTRRQA